MWKCSWQPECEVCGWVGNARGCTESAEALAREQGWVCGQAGPFRVHLCIDCQKHPRPDKVLGERIVWDDADDRPKEEMEDVRDDRQSGDND